MPHSWDRSVCCACFCMFLAWLALPPWRIQAYFTICLINLISEILCCGINILNMYSGSAESESQLGLKLSWQGVFLWFCSNCPVNARTLPSLGHGCFLLNPFNHTIHLPFGTIQSGYWHCCKISNKNKFTSSRGWNSFQNRCLVKLLQSMMIVTQFMCFWILLYCCLTAGAAYF